MANGGRCPVCHPERQDGMKALLVNGSPRKSGCTHTAPSLMGEGLAEGGTETDEFWIGAKPIAGCVEAGRAAGAEPPAPLERRVSTNFIR